MRESDREEGEGEEEVILKQLLNSQHWLFSLPAPRHCSVAAVAAGSVYSGEGDSEVWMNQLC